ncbi:deoxyribodipyrimidine photo-lyase, partial [Klebsiella pneumoniae]
NIEIGVNELKRDKTVQDYLNQHGKELFLFHDRTIFPLHSIRNQSQQPYQVFSAFKKACYTKLDTSGLPQCYPGKRRFRNCARAGIRTESGLV